MIGGNYLYWYLLTASHLGRLDLLILLASPLAAAVLISLFSRSLPEDLDTGSSLLSGSSALCFCRSRGHAL